MTTQQANIAHWYGLEAAYGAMQGTQELPCPHDVGVFVGYDEPSGEQMYKCTMCGEVNLD